MLFTDDCTRNTHLYFLREKSQTLEKFREYKAEVENETKKCLRSDFCNGRFDNILKSADIKHQKTVPYTPEQNGVKRQEHLCVKGT